MSEASWTRNQVARKQHSCWWCMEPIVIGEKHLYFFSTYEDPGGGHLHLECEEAYRREVYDPEDICDCPHSKGKTCAEIGCNVCDAR